MSSMAHSNVLLFHVSKSSIYLMVLLNFLAAHMSLCRWNMSKEEEVYNAPPPAGKTRSLVSLKESHRFSQPEKHLGSKYMPLLNLEPSNLNELHILPRIADVLMRNLIHIASRPPWPERAAKTGYNLESHEHIVGTDPLMWGGLHNLTGRKTVSKQNMYIHVLLHI